MPPRCGHLASASGVVWRWTTALRALDDYATWLATEAAPAGAILEVSVNTSSISASTTPITILSAAAGGSYWEIVYALVHWRMQGGAFFNNSVQANLFYKGATVSTVAIFNFSQYYATTTNDYWCFATKVAAVYPNTNTTGINPTGASVVLKANADTTLGGPGGGTVSGTIHVGYVLRTAP